MSTLSAERNNIPNHSGFVYRLESPWRDWSSYFQQEMQYTCTREIDRIHEHGWPLRPTKGQDICGLWALADFEDAIRFQESEPLAYDAESRAACNNDALAQLSGRSGLNPTRFCARIQIAAFNGDLLYPDLPLIYQYPSSCFHPRLFDTRGESWRLGHSSSRLIPHATIPDRWVEVYFDGAWYPKSTAFGSLLKNVLLHEESIDGLLLTAASLSAPRGDLDGLSTRVRSHPARSPVQQPSTPKRPRWRTSLMASLPTWLIRRRDH